MDSLFVTKNGALVGCIEWFSEKIFYIAGTYKKPFVALIDGITMGGVSFLCISVLSWSYFTTTVLLWHVLSSNFTY